MKPAVVGLTGGIGSGKTTIAGFFRELGVPVYIADNEAKKILHTPIVISELRAVFGSEVFSDNLPDRKKIASLVFNNPEKLLILNNIIHPKVKLHFTEWQKQYNHHKFIIKEAAILFESGSYKDCNSIILVTAPLEVRIARVMKRDTATRAQVLQRIANQWDEDEKIKRSNFIIHNATLQKAQIQVLKIYQTLNQ